MFQGKVRRALARERGGIGQGCLNIRFLDGRVAGNDFFTWYARGKGVEDDGNHPAAAADTRLPVTDRRVNRDALLPVGHAPFYLAVPSCSYLIAGHRRGFPSAGFLEDRSEERRVGKESRTRWS